LGKGKEERKFKVFKRTEVAKLEWIVHRENRGKGKNNCYPNGVFGRSFDNCMAQKKSHN